MNDPYQTMAARYDAMHQPDPARQAFFERLFAERGIANVLDCACGTGRDLLMFNSLGINVQGSDLSPSMLDQACANLRKAGIAALVTEADFCKLPESFAGKFDAAVCLTNSINEVLDDALVITALKSMARALRKGGTLVLDQGQTDFSMRNPARFSTVVNNQELTRFFVLDYAKDIMTVNIFDFQHSHEGCGQNYSEVKLKIRLADDWKALLNQAGLTQHEFVGGWHGEPYDKGSSARLIIVARN